MRQFVCMNTCINHCLIKALHSATNEMNLFVLFQGHRYLFLLTSMYDFYGLVLILFQTQKNIISCGYETVLCNSFQVYFLNGGIRVLIFLEWLPWHLTTFSSSLIGYRFNSLIKFSNVCSQCCVYRLRFYCKNIKIIIVHTQKRRSFTFFIYLTQIYRSIWKLFCLKRKPYAIPRFHFRKKCMQTLFAFSKQNYLQQRYSNEETIIELNAHIYIFSYACMLIYFI